MSSKSASMRGEAGPWPNGARFALFLSHDVDQVYERELFRILGDFGHLGRLFLKRVPGSLWHCLKRIARHLLWPRPLGLDIERILQIEHSLGLRSTFFLLEDRTFSRFGGRYLYSDPEVRILAKKILDGGSEIAVHGAYHHYNDVAHVKAQKASFERAFGIQAAGIRNHYLRHDGRKTWEVQQAAGYDYDATFGFRQQVGVREGRVLPFLPLGEAPAKGKSFVAIPMTIMDCVLFWVLKLTSERALAVCKAVADEVIEQNGLLCLNWHNNYFNEEEFAEWEQVYRDFLAWLIEKKPWNATGREIASYWRDQQFCG